jgi:hypothetical protein
MGHSCHVQLDIMSMALAPLKMTWALISLKNNVSIGASVF